MASADAARRRVSRVKLTPRVVWAAGIVNRKAETVRREYSRNRNNRFPPSFGIRARGHRIGNAEHPLSTIYAAIRDRFQAKCLLLRGSACSLR
jgi:hypothetical protein